jgi:hypothetical protein
MGYEHVEMVLESKRYRGPTKAVLVALAHHINAKRYQERGGWDEVWPGYARLQAISGWSRAVVKREIDRLMKDGVVSVKEYGKGTESTKYIIHIDRVSAVAETLGSEQPQVGSDEPQAGVTENPGVGSERPPKRGIGSGELNLEENAGKSLSLSPAGQEGLSSSNPKTNPQTSGTTVPEPRSGTSRPETHGGFVPQERPSVPPSPRPEIPSKDLWSDKWTKAQRDDYFKGRYSDKRTRLGWKLVTLFESYTEKPGKLEDFLSLLDGGYGADSIGQTIIWVMTASDGHWEFHNSKHFCKDSVYPVVAEQYKAWSKKQKKAKKMAA